MKRRIGRVLWRTGLTLVCLLVAVLLTVQIILSWSQWPRDLVVSQIQKQTGLSVSIGSLGVSWGGSTTASDVRLVGSDPDHPVFTAQTLRIKHAPLWSLAFGGGLNLKHVQVKGVMIDLVQDAAGRWNVQSVLDAFQTTQNNTPDTQPLSVPAVDIPDATVRVTLATGRQVTLAPVTIHTKNQVTQSGQTTGSASQKVVLEVSAGRALQIDGVIALARPFDQTLTVRLKSLAPFREVLTRRWQDGRAQLTWSGRIEQDKLTGLLTIQDLQAGSASQGGQPLVKANGKASISAQGSTLVFEPHGLHIIAPTWLPGEVQLTQGQSQLDLSTKKFTLKALQVSTLGGQIDLDGQGRLVPLSGQLAVNWRQVLLPTSIQQAGSAQINLRRATAAGPFQLEAQVHTQGDSAMGQWDGNLVASAKGSAWDQLTWTLDLGSTSVSNQSKKLIFNEAQWRGSLQNGVFSLDQFTLPVVSADQGQGQVTGSGRYQLDDGHWSLKAKATSAQLDGKGHKGTAMLQFSGSRHDLRGSIEQLTFDNLTGQLQGSFDWKHEPRVQATFALAVTPPTPQDAMAKAISEAMSAAVPDANSAYWKKLSVQGRVAGPVQALDLKLDAKVSVENLVLGHAARPASDIKATPDSPEQSDRAPSTLQQDTPTKTQPVGQSATARLVGRLTPKELTLKNLPADLFQGKIAFEVAHTFEDGRTTVKAKADGVALAQLDQLMRSPLHLRGIANAQLSATTHQLSPDHLDVKGQWAVKDFQTAFLPPTQAHGRLLVDHGDVKLLDVTAKTNSGEAVGQIHTRLASMNLFDAKLTLTNWPVALPMASFELRLNGKADLSGDTATDDFKGSATLKAVLFKNHWPFATANVTADISRNAVNLNTIKSVFLGGQVQGSGRVDLADVTQSTADLDISNLNLSLLGLWSGQWSGLKGNAKGKITLAPTHDERALGPLRLTATIEPDTNTRLQRVDLGRIDLEVFLDPHKVLVNRLDIQLAKGRLNMWGRVSRHGKEWFGFAKGQWQNLSFDQLTSLALMFPPATDKTKPAAVTPSTASQPEHDQHSDKKAQGQPAHRQLIPGRFDGQMVVTSSLFDWSRASGHGELSIKNSDLLNVPVFSDLYRILNIAGHPEKPVGYGKASFRIEGPSFILTNAAYVNRGISINLRLRVDDVRRGEQSPLRGLAVVIYNPLPELPLLQGYVDAIMSFQGKATTMAITGSLEDRNIRRVPASFIGQLTRDLFSGSPELPSQPQPIVTPATQPASQPATQPAAQP